MERTIPKPNPSHDLLAIHLRELGLEFEREVPVCPGRKFRWDFTIPTKRVAIEIMGSTWTRGRHTRGQGFQDDCDKANLGVVGGWKVLRFTSQNILSGAAKDFLKQWIDVRMD